MCPKDVCNHNLGFTLSSRVPLFVCNKMCGFTLNFNPEEFPGGVSFSQKENTKPQLPIVSSKY